MTTAKKHPQQATSEQAALYHAIAGALGKIAPGKTISMEFTLAGHHVVVTVRPPEESDPEP